MLRFDLYWRWGQTRKQENKLGLSCVKFNTGSLSFFEFINFHPAKTEAVPQSLLLLGKTTTPIIGIDYHSAKPLE